MPYRKTVLIRKLWAKGKHFLSVNAVLINYLLISCGKRLLEIQEIGLYKYWDLWLPPVAHQCLTYTKQEKIKTSDKENPPALTRKNLTGAFIVFALGICLSTLAFLCEQITFFTSRPNSLPRVSKWFKRFFYYKRKKKLSLGILIYRYRQLG